MKKLLCILIAILCLASCCMLSACSSDKLNMSLKKISEAVIFNQSMVGIGKEFWDNIRAVKEFTNDDSQKMKYLTNNLYSDEFNGKDDVVIVQGILYEVFLMINDVDYARAEVAFVEFESSALASEALKVIQSNLNLKPNADGRVKLTFGEAVVNKNVVCVIATQEVNTYLELKRVFLSSSYVR